MSERDGRTVLEEANLWVEASRMAMMPAQMRRVDGPWERLLDAGKVLSLSGEAFNKFVSAVKYGSNEEYEKDGFVVSDEEDDGNNEDPSSSGITEREDTDTGHSHDPSQIESLDSTSSRVGSEAEDVQTQTSGVST